LLLAHRARPAAVALSPVRKRREIPGAANA